MKTTEIWRDTFSHRLAASGPRAARRVWVMLLLGLVVAAACADPIAAANKACPCAYGSVCCSSGVCAASEDACAAASLALGQEAQGVWTGYFENFNFPSGSDSLEIVLSAPGEQMSATVKMGADGASEPPSGWTPDGGLAVDPNALDNQAKEGFSYQARDLRWESRRLKLTVRFGDPWAEHCSAYLPTTVEDYTFYCPRSATYFPPNECSVEVRDRFVPVECQLLDRCATDYHCMCDENACTATDAQASLDIAPRGDAADGSILFSGRPINVRLVRRNR